MYDIEQLMYMQFILYSEIFWAIELILIVTWNGIPCAGRNSCVECHTILKRHVRSATQYQCLQTVLLFFSIYFSVFCMLFQYFSVFYKKLRILCTWSSNFSVFSRFHQYLCSEFSKNTGKSVYLEAMQYTVQVPIILTRYLSKSGFRSFLTATRMY